MRRLIVGAVFLVVALLVLLFLASGDSALFSDTLPALFAIGGVLSLALLVLVGWQLWVLQRRIRRGVFGAKLTLRLMLMFGLVAMLPGMVVYGASVFFLNRSIETWFDVRVDNALASGVNLGQAALDDLLRELDKKSQRMALTLADEGGVGSVITMLSTLREQSAVQELTLFDERGGVIAHVGSEPGRLLPVMPERSVLWQVRQQQPYSRIEEVPELGLIMRVLVPVYTSVLSGETRVLQLVQPVPSNLARDAQAVQMAYQEYQQIAISRLSLKRIYGFALTLTLMLALLMTIIIAYLLSERLGAPLRALARGTRAVAMGDYTQMPNVSGRDELGALIQKFNRMTRQLSDARQQLVLNHQETERAKAFLERVLANLSSGVIVLDEALSVRTANSAAATILGVHPAQLEACSLNALGQTGEALSDFGAGVASRFAENEGEWQTQIDYLDHGEKKTLLVRGTHLPAGMERGYVVVFDDVTKLINAERNAAWSEVARRLAHEIKNPLTPIQLSAERIAHKLGSKLAQPDAEFLARSTQTIVNQVAAMKSMVDAFAGYARMPRAKLEALNLNELVREILTLYDTKALGLELDLDENLPRVAGDSTLLRQVIHNLLQNAQDALVDHATPRVEVSTSLRGRSASLTVTDNGAGFPEHLMSRLFEPYATTKSKGTGLGLAIVKKIVEEHHGKIHVENIKTGGAAIRIALPVFEAAGEGRA